MISRVAESCFWLNRYVERVESLARLLDVNLALQLDADLPVAERWRPLVVVCGQEQDFLARTPRGRIDDAETVQAYLVWDEANPASLHASLRAARENARTIRETISLEMWESLNDVWVWLHEKAARRLYERERTAFYRRLRDQCLLFHGFAQATMLHEDPFEFMRLGTALERVSQTARILDVKHHSVGPSEGGVELPAEVAQWLATLRSCAGVEAFFKRKDHVLSGSDVVAFLLFDRAFPRSVLHNLHRARNFLGLVRPPRPTAVGERTEALLGRLLEELGEREKRGVAPSELHALLTWIVDAGAEACAAVHADFFDPAPGLESGQAQAQSTA